MTPPRHRYVWPEGRASAACFSVDVDAESPYLWTNRHAMPNTLGVLEQRRFGPREGLFRLVEMIERFGIRGSFYVPGVTAERYPWILPWLVERGHEVGLHGWLHEVVAQSSDAEFEAALDRALAIFEAQTGQRPVGFRSPAWEMTPGMIAGLKARGIAYDSSLMGYDHPYEIDGLPEIPVHWSIDDAPFFRYFGGGLDTSPPSPPQVVGEAWLEEWRMGRRHGALFMITVHPWISGRLARIGMHERILETICAESDVWWATAAEIAAWHAASPNAGRFAVESAIPEAPLGPRP